jgi:hypothetical protein
VEIGKRFVYILRSDNQPKRHYVAIASDVAQRLRGLRWVRFQSRRALHRAA